MLRCETIWNPRTTTQTRQDNGKTRQQQSKKRQKNTRQDKTTQNKTTQNKTTQTSQEPFENAPAAVGSEKLVGEGRGKTEGTS